MKDVKAAGILPSLVSLLIPLIVWLSQGQTRETIIAALSSAAIVMINAGVKWAQVYLAQQTNQTEPQPLGPIARSIMPAPPQPPPSRLKALLLG